MFQHAAARRRLASPWPPAAPTSRFNTQPPEGGWLHISNQTIPPVVSTRSRPKAAVRMFNEPLAVFVFQHAAARRRLVEAAGGSGASAGFNTQPPEGGWQSPCLANV